MSHTPTTMPDKELAMFKVLTPKDVWIIENALAKITTGHTIALHRRMVDAAWPPSSIPQMNLEMED